MRDKPYIIELVGADMSFKSTIGKYLEEKLLNNTFNEDSISFGKDYDTIKLISGIAYDHDSSYYIRSFLDGKYGDPSKVCGFDKSVMYSLHRYDLVNNLYKSIFNNHNAIIIIDGWTSRNPFYHITEKDCETISSAKALYNNMISFEKDIQIPKADTVIMCTQSIDIAEYIIRSNKRPDKKDLIESNIEYLREEYKRFYDFNSIHRRLFLDEYIKDKNFVDIKVYTTSFQDNDYTRESDFINIPKNEQDLKKICDDICFKLKGEETLRWITR